MRVAERAGLDVARAVDREVVALSTLGLPATGLEQEAILTHQLLHAAANRSARNGGGASLGGGGSSSAAGASASASGRASTDELRLEVIVREDHALAA